MKAISGALNTHFQGDLTTIAVCWKVTRKDGAVLCFTDHDLDLTIDALVYNAESGFYRTAISNSATTAVDNLEVRGFLDSDTIAEKELRNGAFDFAEVEIFAVNWKDLSMGICRLRYGFFGEVTIRPTGLFVVELRGLMQLFSQTVGETISPDCRADLGDSRCKVKLVPDVHMSNRLYAVGDRILVPTDATRVAARLPVLNDNFDWYQSATYQSASTSYSPGTIAWAFSGCVVSNYPLLAHTGSHYVKPTAGTGYARRLIPNTLTGVHDLTFEFWVKQNALYWETGALIELLNSAGTVLDTFTLGYSPNSGLSAWEQRTFNETGVDLTGVANVRITARFAPGSGNPSPTSAAAIQIDDFEFAFDATPYTDLFMGFDQGYYITTTVANWSNGISNPGNVNLLPVHGTAFLSHSWLNYAGVPLDVVQTVSVEGLGVSNAEIDAGAYSLNFRHWVSSSEWGASSRVGVSFRNAGGSTISTAYSDWEAVRPAGQWDEREWLVDIPPLTRSVILRLSGDWSPERMGEVGQPSTAYDRVEVELVHDDNEANTIVGYGGIEYEATSAGYTSTTIPTFTHTLAETVDDGDVTWEAVNPQYTFIGTIDTVVSNTQFTLPDIDAETNWFRWGVLTFLDGENIGRAVEVISWNNSIKRITLMLPALLPIEPGDMIMVHAGCDKTRGVGGCLKFSNILNYRGEPDVPGTDQYFKVGGTGA